MKRKQKKGLAKRWFALALALVMTITLMPLQNYLAATSDYETDPPVIESFTFTENGTQLETDGKIHLEMQVYDVSEIETINVEFYADSEGYSDWVYVYKEDFSLIDESQNLYSAEIDCSKFQADSYKICEIEVVDEHSNYVTYPVCDESGEYKYGFTLNREKLDISIEDIEFSVESGATITYNPDESTAIDVSVTLAQDFAEYYPYGWIYFENETDYGRESCYVSYNEESGKLEGSFCVGTYTKPGTWKLSDAEIDIGVRDEYFSNLSFSYEFNVVNDYYDSSYDESEYPVVKNITMDQEKEILEPGDVVNFTVEMDPAYAYQKSNATISLYGVVDSNYDRDRSLELTYQDNDIFTGTFTVDEEMYPTEWYVSGVWVEYIEGNWCSCNFSNDEFYSTLPYYFYVYNNGTMVTPTHAITVELYGFDGENTYSVLEKEITVNRRTTWKELKELLGEELPDSDEFGTIGGWSKDTTGSFLEDEDELLFSYDGDKDFYAQYPDGKFDVFLEFEYANEKSFSDKEIPVEGTYGMTFKEAMEKVQYPEIPEIEGIDFKEWTTYYYGEEQIVSPYHRDFYLCAEYSKIPYILEKVYVKDGKIVSEEKLNWAEENTTEAQVVAEVEDLDSNEDYEFVKWGFYSDENDGDYRIYPYGHVYVYAKYEKTPIGVEKSFYDEFGNYRYQENVVWITEGDTVGDVVSNMDKPEGADIFGFEKWSTNGCYSEESTIDAYDYLYLSAEYQYVPVQVRKQVINQYGQWETVTEAYGVEEGTTYEELLEQINCPETKIKNLEFTGWNLDFEEGASEELYAGAWVYVTADYDNIPVVVRKTYLDDDGVLKYETEVVAVKEGATYNDILKTLASPNTDKAKYAFKGWEYNIYEWIDETEEVSSECRSIQVEGNYDVTVVEVYRDYLNSDKETVNDSQRVYLEKDTTVQDLLDQLEAPEAVEGVQFEEWKALYYELDETFISLETSIDVIAVYDKKEMDVSFTYLTKTGEIKKIQQTTTVAGDSTVQQFIDSYVMPEDAAEGGQIVCDDSGLACWEVIDSLNLYCKYEDKIEVEYYAWGYFDGNKQETRQTDYLYVDLDVTIQDAEEIVLETAEYNHLSELGQVSIYGLSWRESEYEGEKTYYFELDIEYEKAILDFTYPDGKNQVVELNSHDSDYYYELPTTYQGESIEWYNSSQGLYDSTVYIGDGGYFDLYAEVVVEEELPVVDTATLVEHIESDEPIEPEEPVEPEVPTEPEEPVERVDTTNPVVVGIEDGNSKHLSATFTVEDENACTVLVDGKELTAIDGVYTLSAKTIAQKLVVTDAAGNETTLSVIVTPHMGGTATCVKKAVCTICEQEYGSVDSSKHTGATVEKDRAEATYEKEGYTGDTYCKDCDTKLSTGTVIEKLVKPAEKLEEQVIEETVNTISQASEGEVITLDMKKEDGAVATVVPKEILEEIKGKDVDVVLDMGDYSWTINGKEVLASNLEEINLEVAIDTTAVPPTIVSKVANGEPTRQISLTHNGNFGFKAELTLNLGSENKGQFGNLYYYDSEGKLKFMNAGKIGEDGTATLAFSHASDYVVVIGNDRTTVEQGNGDSANTGDQLPIMPFVVFGLGMGVLLLSAEMKRRISVK